MKLIFGLVFVAANTLTFAQDTILKLCSPTIEAIKANGDIKITNNCGIDEKQLKLQFEKFKTIQFKNQQEIKYSINKIVGLFNEYQLIEAEKLEKIQRNIIDSNLKLDKLLNTSKNVVQKNLEIEKDSLQEAIRRQKRDDLELILTTIPSLTAFTSGDTISNLILESEINLSCLDLIKVLTELSKLGGLSFYSGNFVLSVLERITPPFHQACYSEVGSYISIFERDIVIRRLHSKQIIKK